MFSKTKKTQKLPSQTTGKTTNLDELQRKLQEAESNEKKVEGALAFLR